MIRLIAFACFLLSLSGVCQEKPNPLHQEIGFKISSVQNPESPVIKGTVRQFPAEALGSGALNAVFVQAGKAKAYFEAKTICSSLEPQGKWRLPTENGFMLASSMGSLASKVKVLRKEDIAPLDIYTGKIMNKDAFVSVGFCDLTDKKSAEKFLKNPSPFVSGYSAVDIAPINTAEVANGQFSDLVGIDGRTTTTWSPSPAAREMFIDIAKNGAAVVCMAGKFDLGVSTLSPTGLSEKIKRFSGKLGHASISDHYNKVVRPEAAVQPQGSNEPTSRTAD